MPAKPVKVGSRFFPRQLDALGFFKKMLARYDAGQRVSEIDANDLGELVLLHRDATAKIGCGVDYYKVEKDGYGGRCFWIVRTDGTQIDFSYKRCVTGIW